MAPPWLCPLTLWPLGKTLRLDRWDASGTGLAGGRCREVHNPLSEHSLALISPALLSSSGTLSEPGPPVGCRQAGPTSWTSAPFLLVSREGEQGSAGPPLTLP